MMMSPPPKKIFVFMRVRVSMSLCVSRHSCQDNLRAPLMAALQAQTKLSSSEPGVCPPDLRGAATAKQNAQRPSPLALALTPSTRYPAPPTRRCLLLCARSKERKFLSSPFQGSHATHAPLSHRRRRLSAHRRSERTCKWRALQGNTWFVSFLVFLSLLN